MDRVLVNLLIVICAVHLTTVHTFFVPEQLPTLLSFVYTNIPPIRKGIDSRVGFGFRLGPNADVQVQLELGPQQNTAPVGPPKNDGNSKRDTKRQPIRFRAPIKGSWLHAWKQQQDEVYSDEDIGVLPAQPAMDSDIISHLHQLYREQPAKNTQPTVINALEDDGKNNEVETRNSFKRNIQSFDNGKVFNEKPKDVRNVRKTEDKIDAR